MAQNEALLSVLNDLIKINNDRVEGYQKAIEEAKSGDVDLKATFDKMIDQSMRYVNELTQEVTRLNGEPTTSTTMSGKAYRVWMDIKAGVTGHSRKTVLENCEFGEDAAQKAYEAALEADADMTAEVRQMITRQKSELKESHDLIKQARDMHAKVS